MAVRSSGGFTVSQAFRVAQTSLAPGVFLAKEVFWKRPALEGVRPSPFSVWFVLSGCAMSR